MVFNAASGQQIGIGISAFIITLALGFLLMFAHKDRSGRALSYAFIAIFCWAWIGYAYGTTENLWLAREIRVLSAFSVLAIMATFVNFCLVYLEEVRPLTSFERGVRLAVFGVGVLIAGAVVPDFWSSRLFIGELTTSPQTALSPHAGPLLWTLILYQGICMIIIGIALGARIRRTKDARGRRQGTILFIGIIGALTIALIRWSPWYGFDFAPFIASLAPLLLVTAASYNIKAYRMFEARIAAAEILVFLLWTFTFVRILLSPDLANALPDIVLFPALIIFGVTLIRSIRHSEELTAALQELNGNLEQEVMKRTDALVQEKTEFMTVTAHSLRTPVSGIRWLFNSLRADKEAPFSASQRELIDQGDHAAAYIASVINDLLTFAKASDPSFLYTFERGDIRACIEESIRTARAGAQERNIDIEFSAPEKSAPIPFDRAMLPIVFNNILDNALKYTQPGGHVTITISQAADETQVRIADTGIGITAEDKGKLFSRFFRGERARHISSVGSGLGLTIAKKIIESHGGTLAIESRENIGTTVSIRLPSRNAPMR